MVGTVLAAVSAATSIAGSIAKSRAARKAAEANQAEINKERAENEALYNRRYYEDGTQRADVRRVLTEAGERLRRNNMAAAGTNAVMGGTNATAAAAKEANNEAYANAVSQAAAAADARKDAIEDRYVTNKTALRKQQVQLDAARSEAHQNAITEGVQGVVNAATSFVANNYTRGGSGVTTQEEKPKE